MQRSALWSTLALALCAFVRPATAASPPPAWTVDGANSKLEFTSSFGGDAFKGVFRKWDARIVFDPAALTTSSVVVNVDLGSASTADESRDEALLSSDWFNAAKFPRATFSATKFSSLGGGRYQAAGTLAIRGVSRPVVLPFQLTINGQQARMNGSLTINRSQFGIGQGQFAAADSVPFNVGLNVQVAARRTP